MMEILAPVGAKEQLIAAVRSGADAVYLGTKNFNARKNADNFDIAELNDAVTYCHQRGVKVYLAFNTVITDNEIDEAAEYILDIAKAGVDAVIVQDLGVVSLIKQLVPDMPLHASTQMSVHNLSGVKELEKLGFSRVVPARELSLEELKIIRANTSLELEVFVHGALCMCVSGQCYLSSVLGQRSANRGLCAQPCRLDFKSKSRDHALSLKDLSAIDMLKELENIGIDSAKIEGRMKRPEYVAAATTACKNALLGNDYDREGLKAVFSRSGFTNGYITAKRDGDMFGYRTKQDVVSAAPILKKIANEYRNELPLVAVDVDAKIKCDKDIVLTLNDGTNEVFVTAPPAEIALTKATDIEAVKRSLTKFGSTPFYVKDINIELDDGLFLTMSQLNDLRKNATENLLKKRAQFKPYKQNTSYSLPNCQPKSTAQQLIIRVENLSQVDDRADKIIADYNVLYEDKAFCKANSSKLIIELPTVKFYEGAIHHKLDDLKAIGIDTIYAQNIYAINIAKQHGFKIWGGFALNINNSLAIEQYAKMGAISTEISFECSLERFDRLKNNIPCGVVAYGKMPLMTFRNCPIKSDGGCEKCGGKGTLTDRLGCDMTVICRQKQFCQLINPIPIYMGDKLSQLKKADFITLYFTDEGKSECKKVIDCFLAKRPFYDKFTRGLYYKEIK